MMLVRYLNFVRDLKIQMFILPYFTTELRIEIENLLKDRLDLLSLKYDKFTVIQSESTFHDFKRLASFALRGRMTKSVSLAYIAFLKLLHL